MKNNFAIIITATLIILTSGCKKYVEGNDVDPNRPSKVTPGLMLSAAELGTFANYTGQLSRIANIMVRQGVGGQFQLSDIGQYVIKEGDDDNEFQSIYTDALINDQTIITTYGADHKVYKGIAEVLKAVNLGLLTDTWGDVPDLEALNGLAGNFTPHFNTQEQIYTHIQQLLDSAIIDLHSSGPNVTTPTTDDFVHGGDVTSWVQTANALKARYHNHLSKRDPAGSATNALADIANLTGADITASPTFGSTGVDMFAYFGEAGNNQSTYYQFIAARAGYLKLDTTFVNMLTMSGDTDPRLTFFVGQDVNGGYTGTDEGTQDLNTSDVGPLYNSAASPLPIITYVEVLFIQAEANLRAGHTADAATALNSAIQKSVRQVTGADADPTWVAAHASYTGTEANFLKIIMTEKYKALFLQYECWTDWRRTNFPTLNINAKATLTAIPRRLPTSLTERQYNPNAANFIVSDPLKPVWWDQ